MRRAGPNNDDRLARNLAEAIVDLLKAERSNERLLDLVAAQVRRAIQLGRRGSYQRQEAA
jgi:hypothetical protein